MPSNRIWSKNGCILKVFFTTQLHHRNWADQSAADQKANCDSKDSKVHKKMDIYLIYMIKNYNMLY